MSIPQNPFVGYTIFSFLNDWCQLMSAPKKDSAMCQWGLLKAKDGLMLVNSAQDASLPPRTVHIKDDMCIELRHAGRLATFPVYEKPRNFDEIRRILIEVPCLNMCSGSDGKGNCPQVYFIRKPHSSSDRCKTCQIKHKNEHNKIKNRLARAKKKQLNESRAMKTLKQTLKRRDQKIADLKAQVKKLIADCDALTDRDVENIINKLPDDNMKEAIRTWHKFANTKDERGMRYTRRWIMECLLLRIKSRKAYLHVKTHGLLPLPALSTLNRYVRNLQPQYGFDPALFRMLKKKGSKLAVEDKRGALVLDEIQLSMGIHFSEKDLSVLGFTDLGKHTPTAQKDARADHALVFLFQSFRGSFVQNLAPFLSKGAASGEVLAELVLECIVLMEVNGFFIDAVVTDGATWNRGMWKRFDINHENNVSCEHPCPYRNTTQTRYDEECQEEEEGDEDKLGNDEENLQEVGADLDDDLEDEAVNENKEETSATFPIHKEDGYDPCQVNGYQSRRLWFISDFSHLIKNLRNWVMSRESFKTPDGVVKKSHWRAVVDGDGGKKGLALKIAFKLSSEHLDPKYYEKMNVAKAFDVFSPQVIASMKAYRKDDLRLLDCDPTISFIERVYNLIVAMTSRTPDGALEPNSNAEKAIQAFRKFIHECEKVCYEVSNENMNPVEKQTNQKKGKFLTSSTNVGFKVTLRSTLEIMYNLRNNCGFKYLMTARLNQDSLEGMFGMIRSCCGCHDKPDPLLFINIFRLISFYSLVRPPRGSNVACEEVFDTLLTINDLKTNEARIKNQFSESLDEILTKGPTHVYKEAARDVHDYNVQSPNEYAQTYFAGYVVRKIENWTDCQECLSSVSKKEGGTKSDIVIDTVNRGFLKYPSDLLVHHLRTLEQCILKTVGERPLNFYTILHIVENMKNENIPFIGCELHCLALTKVVMNFYIVSRAKILCKRHNQIYNESNKKAKEMRKMSKLVGTKDKKEHSIEELPHGTNEEELRKKTILSIKGGGKRSVLNTKPGKENTKRSRQSL